MFFLLFHKLRSVSIVGTDLFNLKHLCVCVCVYVFSPVNDIITIYSISKQEILKLDTTIELLTVNVTLVVFVGIFGYRKRIEVRSYCS